MAARRGKTRALPGGSAPGGGEIKVSRARLLHTLFWSLLAAELLIVALDAAISQHGTGIPTSIRGLFNITREDSIGNWYMTALTLMVGIVAWVYFARARRERLGRSTTWTWCGLAAVFTYLSLDDGSRLHERVGGAFRSPDWALSGALR